MLLPAGVPSSFVTSSNNPDLAVGMSVYDNSGASPVLILGPVRMVPFVGNAYEAKFTPQNGKTYLVFIAIYTDLTFTTLQAGYDQQVESVTAMTANNTVVVQNVTGLIDC
jgi:hypothetical protein